MAICLKCYVQVKCQDLNLFFSQGVSKEVPGLPGFSFAVNLTFSPAWLGGAEEGLAARAMAGSGFVVSRPVFVAPLLGLPCPSQAGFDGGTCHRAAAVIPAKQVGAVPSLALSPGGTVTCCTGGNLVAFPLLSQQLDTCSFPASSSEAAVSRAVTLGPFN